MSATHLKELIKKYDVPAPRYTSYPTVPYWSETPNTAQWIQALSEGLTPAQNTWSMYIHVPFCETLCTYCGCNTSITKNRSLSMPYIQNILEEYKMYVKAVPLFKERTLRVLHLGGGTPTFLPAEDLKKLLQPLLENTQLDQHFEGSIEVDPRRTSVGQLEVLRELGFSRVSLGVQDFDPEVQRIVNRIQPFEVTEKVTLESRRLGYTSVNFDLIYGLPKQNLDSIQRTTEATLKLRPDRIALYSLAVVPWIKPQQRLFKDEDLPQGEEKRALYEKAREALLNGGYKEIGMDHFALPTDPLYLSLVNKTLHRNFMGYTDNTTQVMLGLGVSSISESPTCFHQNEKVLNVYERRILAQEIPTHRGHKLSEEDRIYRQQILQLMTQGSVEFLNEEQCKKVMTRLRSMIDDQLVSIDSKHLEITVKGLPFLRNAAMAFDERLLAKAPNTKLFSSSI